MYGYLAIAVTYTLMATFTITGFDYGVLIMICTFLLIYQNSNGPVSWAYCAETVCDGALGVIIGVLYSVVVVLSLTT